VIDAARGILTRPEIAAERITDIKIERLYRLIYDRSPTGGDFALAREFLAGGTAEPGRWQLFAQALLMANEFVFVD
jgi:hypothetical protein